MNSTSIRNWRRWVLSIAVVALIAAAVVVLSSRRLPFAAHRISHVVLISIDTCRADHLGCYGYTYPTTPYIDALATESVLFENAYSPVPLTLPAHASMLTGTIPPRHGIHDNNEYRVGDFNVTLAEILRDEGFATAAVVGAVVLDSPLGLDQGFDMYFDRFSDNLAGTANPERRAEDVSSHGLRWLEAHRDDRAFLFLHYFDPHATYDPPEPYKTRFGERPYDGEIAYTDHCIGLVIQKLKDLGLYDSTLLIITSDHGEMLGEHGEKTHGYFIYQSAVKVPLIIKLPGQHPARRLTDPVGLIDIVPTVCELLDIALPNALDGMSLEPYLKSRQLPPVERQLYCESLYATKFNANGLYGLVTDQWKYIHTTRPELYDLHVDSAETNNLVSRNPQWEKMRQDLDEVLSVQRLDLNAGSRQYDAELARKLRSLGYVTSSSVDESFTLDSTKEDPKDLIDVVVLGTDIFDLINAMEYDLARELCTQLITERPEFYSAHLHLGSIELALRNDHEAVVHLMRAHSLNPTSQDVLFKLGQAHRALEQWDLAVECYQKILERWPGQPSAHNNLGNTLNGQGKTDEAIHHLREAVRLNPDDPFFHNNLGAALAERGNLKDAVEQIRAAIRLKLDDPMLNYNLGVMLRKHGKSEEALHPLREAVRLDPDNPRPHNTLASLLAELGMLDAAIDQIRASLRLNNDDAAVHYGLGKLLAVQKKREDAIISFRCALELQPHLFAAHAALGEMLKQQGLTTEAIRQFRRALEIAEKAGDEEWTRQFRLQLSKPVDQPPPQNADS